MTTPCQAVTPVREWKAVRMRNSSIRAPVASGHSNCGRCPQPGRATDRTCGAVVVSRRWPSAAPDPGLPADRAEPGAHHPPAEADDVEHYAHLPIGQHTVAHPLGQRRRQRAAQIVVTARAGSVVPASPHGGISSHSVGLTVLDTTPSPTKSFPIRPDFLWQSCEADDIIKATPAGFGRSAPATCGRRW